MKVKLDDRLISERLIAIRQAAPEATLIVDANESWHSEGLAARCQLLADLGVAMLEQPLPADDARRWKLRSSAADLRRRELPHPGEPAAAARAL